MKELLACALAAPARPRRGPWERDGEEAETVRTRALGWTLAAAVHAGVVVLAGAVAMQLRDAGESAVFTVTLRPPGPAKAVAAMGDAGEPNDIGPQDDPADADAAERAARAASGPERGGVRVGAHGEFTLDDVLAGRVESRPVAEVPAPEPAARMRVLSFGAEARFELRRRSGALVDSEASIASALIWLARHQRPDGAWGGLPDGGRCAGPGLCLGPQEGPSVGLTALALLAFTGAGWDGHREEFDACARRAAGWLARAQAPDGCLGPKVGGFLYDHGFATLALVEAADRLEGVELNDALAGAVRFLWAAQQEGGGWDYTHRASGRADACVSAVQVAALRAAADRGIRVPGRMLVDARAFFERLSAEDGTAAYAEGGAGSAADRAATRGSTASAYLARLYLGTPATDPWMAKARARIASWRSSWSSLSAPDPDRSNTLYFWFWAAQGLIHAGPEVWRTWNFHLQHELADAQLRSGCAHGSWAPPDAWIARKHGPLLATALAVLVLETHDRQACEAAYARPLRPASEALREPLDRKGVAAVLAQAARDCDRSVLNAELADEMTDLGVVEYCAALPHLKLAPGETPAILRRDRLRMAWEACVRSSDVAVRRRAAALTPGLVQLGWYPVIARLAAEETDGATRAALLDALAWSPEPSLADSAVTAALRTAEPESAVAALRLVRAHRLAARLPDCLARTDAVDERVRREAVLAALAVAATADEAIYARVLRWLQHPDGDVRRAAQEWLRARRSEEDRRAAAQAAAERGR